MAAAEENGQIKSAIGPWLDRRQRERRAFVARTQFPTKGDKSVRAQSMRGRMASGGLYIPADAPWRAEVEATAELPTGKHDDIADALGLCGRSSTPCCHRRLQSLQPSLWTRGAWRSNGRALGAMILVDGKWPKQQKGQGLRPGLRFGFEVGHPIRM